MGLVRKRKTKNSTPEQQNTQVTQLLSGDDASPVEISEQEETEILQSAKDFAQKCKVKFNEGTLNWLIGFNCFSLFFYISHIVCNIYWLITYYTNGDTWYFGCFLAFWFISAIIMITRSFFFYNYDWIKTHKDTSFDPRDYLPEQESNLSWKMKWVLGFFCPIPRYYDTIKYARKAKQARTTDENIYFVAMIWEDAELLQLRQFDSFMESAPQLLLSLYIAINEDSLFGYLSILKIVTIGSLSWALVSYDNKICLIKGIKKGEDADRPNPSNGIGIDFNKIDETKDAIDCIKNINWKKNALSFSAHFSWMVARFMALSLFASVYGWLIWPACLAHLFPILVWQWKKNYNFMDSLRLSFLHVFAYLHPLENEADQMKHPRFSPDTYQSICICENLFLMVMWSQSFIKFDEGINPGILSILYYPWNDWTFCVPWIGQILTSVLTFVLI